MLLSEGMSSTVGLCLKISNPICAQIIRAHSHTKHCNIPPILTNLSFQNHCLNLPRAVMYLDAHGPDIFQYKIRDDPVNRLGRNLHRIRSETNTTVGFNFDL